MLALSDGQELPAQRSQERLELLNEFAGRCPKSLIESAKCCSLALKDPLEFLTRAIQGGGLLCKQRCQGGEGPVKRLTVLLILCEQFDLVLLRRFPVPGELLAQAVGQMSLLCFHCLRFLGELLP